MKPFLSTLFGDWRNCLVVGALIAAEALLVHSGAGQTAGFLIPLAVLAGVFLLARPAR
jgi:hypothetical protein